MSKSNFSKAMKELIGINENDKDESKENDDSAGGLQADSALFSEMTNDLEVSHTTAKKADLSFDQERDDAAAKLRMMLNKDRESEKKETGTNSFADKIAKSGLDEKKTEETSGGIIQKETPSETVEATYAPTPTASRPAPVATPRAPEKNISPEDAKTVIGQGVVITGSIIAQGNLEIKGIIRGDVKTSGNVILSGKIAGDLGTSDLEILENGAIQGDIMARGKATIKEHAVVIGDITAGSISLNGKVKGNLAAREVADLSDNSIIDGNVSAASVAINPNTKLRGQISLTSASDVNDDDFIIDFDA